MINCICSNFANAIGLKQQKTNILIGILAGKTINVKREVNAMISNSDSSFLAPVNFFVVLTVTNVMPMQKNRYYVT